MNGGRELAVSEPFSSLDGDGTWVGGPGLLGSLWRYRLVIGVVTVVAALAGLAVSLALPARYEAQSSLFLRDPGSPAVLTLGGASQAQAGDHAVFMATQADLAGSNAVDERAADLLRAGPTAADIGAAVTVKPSADLTSITVRATADDPAQAVNLANAVGTAFQQVSAERVAADSKNVSLRLQDVIAQREAEFDALRAQLAQSSGPDQAPLERKANDVADLIGSIQVHQSEIASQAALYGSGVESFQPAVPPASSSQPAPLLLALLGALLGFIAASGWAWWVAGRNRRVEADDDAGAILGVPLLGDTPRLDDKLRRARTPSSPDERDPVAEEAYHVVLTALEHALSKVDGKVVAVVGAMPGDGKTTAVLNLALAAKREGRKVLLVDADERTRRLSQLCRDDGHFDVIGVTHDGRDGEERPVVAGVPWSPTAPGATEPSALGTVLQIAPSKPNGHHPAVFFRSTAFGNLISLSGQPADLVLIDTPALLGVSEAVTIVDHADAVLMVVNHGTSLADLRRARERLAFTDTPLIGYLLNRRFPQRAYAEGRAARRGGLVQRARKAIRDRRGPTVPDDERSVRRTSGPARN
jgi:Mrp family chromosome partitioning ATPase/capsular polysaccharide biosynthesis protein